MNPMIISVYAHTCDECGELMKSEEQMNRHLIEKHGWSAETRNFDDYDRCVYDEDRRVIYRPSGAPQINR